MPIVTGALSAHQRFLVLGRAGMDLYPDPPGTRTEEATNMVVSLGGSAANIAVALTRHDLQAALLTRVSDDAIGRYCINQLAYYGVDTRHVTPVGGEARNSLAVVESRIQDHQSVIYRNGAADFELTNEDIEHIDFSSFDALISSGTALAHGPSRTATFEGLQRARDAGLPVIFDIDYRPYSWPSAAVAADVYSRASSYCDIIVGNEDEFGFMAGTRDQGLTMARQLGQRPGRIVVYKMGENGAITITPTNETRTGIFTVTALKPTGAGDAFMGGFIAGLVRKWPLDRAVLYGSAAAAIVVSRVGCAPAMPTSAELDAFLSSHPGPTITE
ncbi:5-dehydro-2-deoxygluconokinase [Devosia rhodophyticola]|uniref:5-dehydro-2-deoxygluconokinase n=1 Tax=Devosia rhodophyticola TaxID=3026423 RepID=A0ABY7YTZ0_9HYPH|nr:5-dehydro-2-deoxygluconokinase [Devosia rhodophyticola]WDR04781.1 5-dehydro-2-deoxygluconokinase [Devosia rhodophyticola]